MRKITAIAIISVFMATTSCNKQFDNAMKSQNKDVILATANDYYAQKKWRQAIELYELLPKMVAGTPDAAEVVYKVAYANYYDKNYQLAGHRFKSFAIGYPSDERAEEAAYMAAICYYQGSLDYNLDQESTISAIDELQSFLDNYPDSERTKNISELIEELTYKLELKYYEIARQYYKMMDYKAADLSFENVLEDYPSTKLRPQIINYRMRAQERLAKGSIFDLKEERLESAIAFTKQVEKDYPDSENSEEAVKIREELLKEKEAFTKAKSEYEAKLAERQAKLERLQESNKNGESKEEMEYNKKVEDLQRESAKQNTPEAGVKL